MLEQIPPSELQTVDRYNQSIFGQPRDRGYGFSNVHDVFRRTSSQQLIDEIANFYGTRCAHIPDNAQVTGVIVEQKTPRITTHYAEYVSDALQTPLEIEDLSTLNGIHKGALVVPFINTTHVEQQFRVRGLEVWGLPGIIVDAHKNKADCHKLIDSLAVPGFKTPDYRIADIDQFDAQTSTYLSDIRSQYQQTGMDDYTVGMMVRSAESDGNYGGCFIKQEKNGFTLTKHGSGDDKMVFKTEQEVLTAAQNYLRDTGNGSPEVEPRVVISRLMDLADSPGISAIVLDGEIITLPWNGQVQEANSTACSGTTSYNPQTEYLRSIHRQNEAATSSAFSQFIDASLQRFNFDRSHVRGVVNVDLMIPGEREIEFQKRLGQKAEITIAEINPRFTNWTDALLFVVGANGQTKSLNSIHQTIDRGVFTQDKFHFRKGADMTVARDQLAALDLKLKNLSGTRILVRMINENNATMGLVFSGDIDLAQKELDNLANTI